MGSQQDENSVRHIWRWIKFLASYSLLYSIISEILLLINIYSTDPLFFGVSISFLIVPLLLVSLIPCMVDETKFDFNIPRNLRWCLYFPIINIPIVWSADAIQKNAHANANDKSLKSLLSGLLAGLMTFPLYIINLSYLLENSDSFDDISIFNYLQLLFSLINLTIAPIGMFADRLSSEFTFGLSKWKLYLLSTFYVYPMALIEVIHFFPFLFLYYIDEQIVISQLAIILSMFNIPKLLLVIRHGKKVYMWKHDANYCKLFFFIMRIVLFVTVPLIPYIFIIIEKDEASDIVCICENGYCSSVGKYYWTIVLYLLISYGGSTIYTIIIVGGLNELSSQVQIAFGVFIVLIVTIIATLPISFYCIQKERIPSKEQISEVEM